MIAGTRAATVPEGATIRQTIVSFIRDFERAFPNSTLLLNGDAYSEADVEIDVYVPPEEIESAGIKADELALNYDLKTGFFIVPIVLPLDACPVK